MREWLLVVVSVMIIIIPLVDLAMFLFSSGEKDSAPGLATPP